MAPAERERFLVRVLDAQAATKLAKARARADQVATELAEANTRADQAMDALRATLLALLDARARVAACDDPATLQRWILRASIASSAAEALSAP